MSSLEKYLFRSLLNHSFMSDSLRPHGLHHVSLPCPSLSPGFAQNHVQWADDAIQPSHPLLLSSPPALNLFQYQHIFQMSQLFASGDQSIRASASTLVFPMNIQGWFPLGLTSLISLQSKGLSRVFSSTTVQKHQFFSVQPSLWSSSHIYTWQVEKQ